MRTTPNPMMPTHAARRAFLIGATLGLLLALLAAPGFAAPEAKVQVCHIPPGNSDNFHTITVSKNALSAHLAHGDLGGACDGNCDTLCNDADACTIDDCGTRSGCAAKAPVDCNDFNLCTTDSCNSGTGCENEEVPCSDPDACTLSTCAPDTGECVNTPVECNVGEICEPDVGCVPAVACPCYDAALLDDAFPAICTDAGSTTSCYWSDRPGDSGAGIICDLPTYPEVTRKAVAIHTAFGSVTYCQCTRLPGCAVHLAITYEEFEACRALLQAKQAMPGVCDFWP